MTPERWQRACELFEEAASQPAQAREDFLSQHCGDDAELRREVESLLSQDAAAEHAFARLPHAVAQVVTAALPREEDNRAAALVGETVGHYHVRRLLARGASGAVYEAEQQQPRRSVALKVMRPDIISRSALRRFQYETQTLARLRHPHIAQIFEAGAHQLATGATAHWFAMELVTDAQPITEYVRARGQSREGIPAEERARRDSRTSGVGDSRTSGSLNVRERLELMAQVCEAVEHGHQKGVIHRDLKPGNILVDSGGEPKVIDFGIARVTDADVSMTQQTAAGQIIGTLQYMSPEQFDGDSHDLDTRSDVYSLGVVLYELLTGAAPYDVSSTTLYQAVTIVKEREPRDPRDLSREINRNVSAIVMKALAKDRERRYRSAGDLAEDVRRYLRGDAVEARPPRPWERIVRWVGRHPVVVTASLCLLIATVVTLAATTASVWYLDRQPDRVIRYRANIAVEDAQPDSDEARLLARNGNLLHTWGGAPHSVTLAGLAGCSDPQSSRELAIIAYGQTQPDPLRGALCAYDVHGDRDVAVWTRRFTQDDLLLSLRDNPAFAAKLFYARGGLIEDIFPGGDQEIVAVYCTESSQRLIRIYNLTGKCLYEVWHEGDVSVPYWMSGPRLLVLAGDSHLGYYNNVDGTPLHPESEEPLVVFALRPAPGQIGDKDFLRTAAGEGPLEPVWYRCLLHKDGKAADSRLVSLNVQPPGAGNTSTQVELSVMAGPSCAMHLTLDQNGNEIGGTRGWNEAYWKNQQLPDGHPKKLPDPGSFYLGEIPGS